MRKYEELICSCEGIANNVRFGGCSSFGDAYAYFIMFHIWKEFNYDTKEIPPLYVTVYNPKTNRKKIFKYH